MKTPYNPQDRMIIALDVDDRRKAEALVEIIGEAGSFYKVGYQLVYSGEGLALARDLKKMGKRVFLDVKLHDIPNTVSKGIAAIAQMGLDMVTVHAYPQTMQAAAQASSGSDLCVLGVTVLTSMDDDDLNNAGYAKPARELVQSRAIQAKAAGIGGLVASAHEASLIGQTIGSDLAIVTPGIRPLDSSIGDQKRIMTPEKAIAAGASHLVIGRPITQADNPKQVAKNIADEISRALR